MYMREETKQFKVKNLDFGGNNKVYIQSMTNTKTSDTLNTIKQIKALEEAGCEIIRVAIFDEDDAKSLKEIKKNINIPLVCDIHFDPNLAILSILNGADKIRLNPGNITDKNKITEIVNLCKEKNIPIRIGVNSGSLPKDLNKTPEDIVEAARRHIKILEDLNFYNICLSLKASDIDLAYESYKLASELFPYPLHIGITESGTAFSGLIKSSIGISKILNLGIGNTIRVSLTDDPLLEIRAAKEILKNLNLASNVANLVSCPTCGRIQYNMIPIAKEIEEYLSHINKNITVAIMGCAVNGPGEAKDADIGIAGGKGEAILFKKGKIIRKIDEKNIISELKKEIDLL